MNIHVKICAAATIALALAASLSGQTRSSSATDQNKRPLIDIMVVPQGSGWPVQIRSN